MSIYAIEPGLFSNLSDEQRRVIETVIKVAASKVGTVQDRTRKQKSDRAVEQRTLLGDASEGLLDLIIAVKQDANLVRTSSGDLYRVDLVTESGIRYASTARWDRNAWAWRMSFSLPVKDGETDEQARQRAAVELLKR